MNGKVVGLKEDYLHNGDVLSVSTGGDRTASLKMGYGNVNGPPLHPNCRCSIVAHVVAGRDVGVVDVIQVVKPRRVPVPAVKPPEWDWKKVSLSEKAEMTKRFKPLGFSSPISDIAGTDKVGAELVINNAGKEGYRMMKAHPKLTKMVSKYDQPYALRLSNVRGLDNRINIMGKFSTDPLSGIELATKGRVWGHSPVTIGKWNTGRDINYSFRHEYGHLVWRMNATTGMRQEWRTIYTEQLGGKMSIGSNISKYARKDLTEGFSEAFSAFTSPVYNEANLKLLKCVEDFMKKWVGALQ